MEGDAAVRPYHLGSEGKRLGLRNRRHETSPAVTWSLSTLPREWTYIYLHVFWNRTIWKPGVCGCCAMKCHAVVNHNILLLLTIITRHPSGHLTDRIKRQ
jgi:hypothetical protein